jgi:hypothetical protein
MAASVSEEQVRKAVIALLKYIGKQKENSNNLLEDDELLYLVSRRRLDVSECNVALRILHSHAGQGFSTSHNVHNAPLGVAAMHAPQFTRPPPAPSR